jgi:hypothetical protein
MSFIQDPQNLLGKQIYQLTTDKQVIYYSFYTNQYSKPTKIEPTHMVVSPHWHKTIFHLYERDILLVASSNASSSQKLV